MYILTVRYENRKIIFPVPSFERGMQLIGRIFTYPDNDKYKCYLVKGRLKDET